MQTRTITIDQGNIIVHVRNVTRGQEKAVREFLHTTLARLDEVILVPAEKIRAQIKKEIPLAGTTAGMLKAYRLRQNLTQAKLAHLTGIRQGHLSEMEKGKRPIGLKTAKTLAKALNCKLERLVG